MNTLQLRVCFSLAALACGAGAAIAQGTKVPAKRYFIEKGILEIEKSNKTAGVEVLVKETVHFLDWGNTEARLTTTTTKSPFLQGEQVERTWSLRKDGMLTAVDLDTMTGTQMDDPAAGFTGAMNASQQEQFGAGVMEAFGAKTKELDDRDHLGKTCKVTQTSTDLGGMKMVTTTWMWKNIVMKLESSGMGSESSEVVTKIQTDVDIPVKNVTPPIGSNIKKVKSPLGGLGGYGKKR